MIHISLINSLIAHSEGKIEKCKEHINKIFQLHKNYKSEKFNQSIEILINELPDIQKN